ncbi:MAG: hypothetical protein ABI548_00250 [Polyangiaceae bacterium]
MPFVPRGAWLNALASTAVALALCAACEDHKLNAPRDAGLTEPSPNASILPAPLASGLEATGAGKAGEEDAGHHESTHLISDAGAEAPAPEPHALREDQTLPGETPHEALGLTLTARFRWPDAAPPPRVPELNADGVQRARDAVGFDVVVDLAGGRMRFALTSRAFTLPAGSELHARDDLYGHALLWPNRVVYTVFSAGALRSVLSEQRADVVPLVRARVGAMPGGSLFGFTTERAELSTPTGKLEIEQARAANPLPPNASWASGASLCHLLVELADASPTSTVCRSDLVPLRAEYTWPNGEHFAFEVSRLTRRSDLNPSSLAMPPANARFRQSELPPPAPNALLSDSQLSDFRLRPAARTEKLDPNAPKAGLLVVNHTESLRYISVDGAPAARLPSGAEQLLLGLRPGKYQVAARDFFSSDDTLVKVVEVPARFALGDEPEKIH